jgi:hypothetical protein
MLQVLERQTNAEISEPDESRFRSITARAIPRSDKLELPPLAASHGATSSTLPRTSIGPSSPRSWSPRSKAASTRSSTASTAQRPPFSAEPQVGAVLRGAGRPREAGRGLRRDQRKDHPPLPEQHLACRAPGRRSPGSAGRRRLPSCRHQGAAQQDVEARHAAERHDRHRLAQVDRSHLRRGGLGHRTPVHRRDRRRQPGHAQGRTDAGARGSPVATPVLARGGRRALSSVRRYRFFRSRSIWPRTMRESASTRP